MADIQSNIDINVNTGEAISQLKALQRQISAFHTSMAKTGAAGAAVSQNMAQNLINQINAGGKFYAEMKKIRTTTDAFNQALEKNQFTMKEYFRYSGAATKTFGKLFKSEFDTINKVARENVKTLQTQYIKMGRDASGALKAISIRPLALDMNDYATKTAMAAQKQALLNQLLRQGSTNLLNFGKNTQWAGRQLMVGFTVPLMYFGSVAAKTFMQLEEQAIRFKRVYGDMFTTSTETAKALQQVQMLANEFTKYGVAVADTMKMAADVAATGKMGTDLLQQVRQANKLAVLGGIDQQKSLDTIISLTSTFGKTSNDLAKDIDFLNAVENQTILNIDDLTTAIPKAAPVIKQLGGDVQDLAFFMTAMREGGIQAGEGANALKSGLASIINPTKRASEMLAGMGINLKAIVEANKGDVKQLVLEIATALDDLEPLKRAQAIEQLFGKFQFARISTLFQNVIKEGSQAQTVAKLTQATTEELAILSERELKKVEESPMYKFKKEVQDLKTAIAPVGAEFLKALTPIVKFFGQIFDKFNNLSDGTKQFITYVTTLLAGLGPIAIMSFGLLANGLANIIKGFTAVKSLFNGTRDSTKYLGEQTNFLTQQQLEAAGVASSLDQAHMKLTQRFSSEAQAVNTLTTAYANSIAAQRAFMLGMPGKPGQSPMKLASGIVSVPGSGTGDKVPAMLSPKEAVIPAPMAKKYAPLIQGMIADNIPGFAEGYASIYGGQSKMLAPYTMFAPGNTAGGFGMSKSFVNTEGFAQSLRNSAIAATAVENNMEKLNKNIVGKLANEITPYTDEMAQEIRKAAVDSNHISDAFAKAKPKIDAILARMSAAGGVPAQAVPGLKKMMYPTDQDIRQGGYLRTGGVVFNEKTGEVKRSTIYSARQGNAQKFQNKVETVSKYLPIDNPENRKLTRAHVVAENRALAGPMVKVRGRGMASPEVGAAMAELQRKSENIAKGLVTSTVQGFSQGAQAALQSQSPSKKMQQVGQQAGQGAILGMQEYVDDARVAGQKIGQAATTGVYASQSANALYGKSTGITSTDKAIRRQQEKLAKQNKGGGSAPGDNKGPRQSRMGVGGIGMMASTALMAGSMAPGKVGDISQQLMMPVMMISSLFMMMSAPVAAVISLLGLLAFGIYKVNKAHKDQVKATLALTEAMGTGLKANEQYSKFAGTVTATEIMNRQRANKMSPFQIKTGKTTFGESYVQSDEGKARVQNVQKYMAKFGQEASVRDLSNQLVSAVVSGALNYGQARSIAANIGDALQDYDFSLAVNARLIEIIGPNGENIGKNGLEIKTKLIEEQRKTLTQGMNLTPFKPQVAVASSGAARVITTSEYRQTFTESGATVFARMKNLLETQQQMLDATELEYQKKIEAAQIAGDINEVNKLVLAREKERAALLTQNKQNYDAMQKVLESGSTADINAIREAAQMSIKETYKDNPYLLALAGQAQSRINESDATLRQKASIELQIASGDLSPSVVADMFSKFESGEDIDQIINISAQFGGKFSDQMLAIANQFSNKDKALDFVMSFSGKSDAEAQKQLDLFQTISKLGAIGEGINVPIMLEYAQDNSAKGKLVSQTLELMKNKKVITKEFAVQTVGQEALNELAARGQEWERMPEEQRRTFVATTMAVLKLGGDPQMQKAWRNWQSQAGNAGKSFAEFAGYGGFKVTEAAAPDISPAKDGEEENNGGGGPTGSPLDDIVKKLRDVRKASQELTVGWEASGAALKKLAKEALGFGGLTDKLRKQGAGQNVIDFITGLSPEDYDKYRGMFKDIKVLQTSLNNIAIGDYMENQRKISADSINQAVAFKRLTEAGMSLSDAYEAVKDSSFAAAVAQEKLSNIGKLVAQRARTIKEEFDAAMKMGDYSKFFTPGYDAAMKIFDVQEKLIRLQRKAEIDQQQKIIDTSNRQIKLAQNVQAANNYQISRYEDGLNTIDEQADAIKEKYDKQFEALDKISKINDLIAKQEKGRLSVAEALSSGDIYAAARAAQEYRAQAAQDAIDQQRTGMEAARDAQVGALTAGGLTRDQLEEKIKVLKQQNYRIDQDTIAPLQEQARLAQVQLDLINEQIRVATEGYLVAGMTKDQWEAQNIKIQGAEIAANKYTGALNGALGVVGQIKSTYDEILQTMSQLSTMTFSGFADTGGLPPVVPSDDTTKPKKPKKPTTPPPTKNGIVITGSNKYAPLTMTKPGIMGTTSSVKTPNVTLSNIYGSGKSQSYIPTKYLKKSMGGPIYKFASGGFAVGTDTVPAMLTPGEFIVSKFAVDKFGVDNLRSINKGENPFSSVYNYNVSVNVKSDANPNEIANTVMMKIKQVESQRVRGNRI